jgi:hypothetical protein
MPRLTKRLIIFMNIFLLFNINNLNFRDTFSVTYCFFMPAGTIIISNIVAAILAVGVSCIHCLVIIHNLYD